MKGRPRPRPRRSAPAPPTVPLAYPAVPDETSRARVGAFLALLRTRRSVRDFAPDPVPRDVVDAAIAAAASAPSGANRQPWRFVLVGDPALKRRIRAGAEAEEREFYARRATPEWLADLAPLGTGWRKPFLTTAPWLIVMFRLDYDLEPGPGGRPRRHVNYYAQESVGIAAGFLLAALHAAGLATLTHTPSPMGFLNALLERPPHERPFLLIPVGRPAPGARVPDLARKGLDEVRILR